MCSTVSRGWWGGGRGSVGENVFRFFWFAKHIPYLFGYKTGLSLSRMSTNNQISPMQFCSNTSITLLKQYQRSRSVL